MGMWREKVAGALTASGSEGALRQQWDGGERWLGGEEAEKRGRRKVVKVRGKVKK